MTAGRNLLMHVAALVLSAYLRLSWGGWETAVFALSIIGPVAMLLPSLAALGLLRRHRLGANVWVPLTAASGSMVLASALLVGTGDLPEPTIPLFELLELPWNRSEWGAWTNPVGLACAVAFLVFLGWALLQVAASASPPEENARCSADEPGGAIEDPVHGQPIDRLVALHHLVHAGQPAVRHLLAVRHEALVVRMEVGDLHRWVVVAVW